MPDRLDAMQLFVAVADTGGFAVAARKAGLAPSVVTRLIAGLEERLGVRLLQRTTRSVKLTDAGARYLERCRRILADVEDAELSAHEERAQPRGRLVVSAPVLFGRMHVAAIVSRYVQTYPEVRVELRLSDRFVNLVEDGVDVAIRIGVLDDSSLVARQLGRTRRMLVASPEYLAGPSGIPKQPSDLPNHNLVSFDAITPGRTWPFCKGNRTIDIEVEPGFATNSGEAALDHVIAGGGITAALCYQADAALRARSLVEVLEPFSPPPMPIHAVFPSSRLLSTTVRAFINLAEQAASDWQFLAPWDR